MKCRFLNLIKYSLPMYNEEVSPTPVLFFLLEHKKYPQITKIMLSRELSATILKEYGWEEEKFSQYEEHKIKKSLRHFTIEQLIEIQGSSHNRVKFQHNRILKEIMKRKLRGEVVEGSGRKKLWIQFTEIYQKSTMFDDLKQLNIALEFLKIIEKDLKRTKTTPQIKEKAKQVLMTFAKYSPYIGYCQGMHSVAVFFLQEDFTCQEVFFILKRLTQIVLPCDYYIQMNSIVAYMTIFLSMLQFTHPKCYTKMLRIAKDMQNYEVVVLKGVIQWFVCLFTNTCISKNLTRIIMDYLLLEGIGVLFKAGIALFDSLQQYIAKINSFEQLIQVFEKVSEITDESHLRKRLNQMHVSEHILHLFKEKCLEISKEQKTETSLKVSKKQEKKCNQKWNVCLQTIEQNRHKENFCEVLVFKTANQVVIQENYMEKLNKQYFSNKKSKHPSDNLLVGRMEHICRPRSQTLTEGSLSDKKKHHDEYSEKQDGFNPNDSGRKQFQINRDSQKKIRDKIELEIEEIMQQKVGLARSQSMNFMKQMVNSLSIENLLELYDEDEMFSS